MFAHQSVAPAYPYDGRRNKKENLGACFTFNSTRGNKKTCSSFFSLLLHPIHNNKQQEPTETVVLFKPPHPYRPVIKSHTARPLHSRETRKELMLHFKSENKISTRDDPRNCWIGIDG